MLSWDESGKKKRKRAEKEERGLVAAQAGFCFLRAVTAIFSGSYGGSC